MTITKDENEGKTGGSESRVKLKKETFRKARELGALQRRTGAEFVERATQKEIKNYERELQRNERRRKERRRKPASNSK